MPLKNMAAYLAGPPYNVLNPACISRGLGGLVHKAPTITGSRESSKYTAIIPHAEKQFLYFKPKTSRSQWSNLTTGPC